MVKSLRWSNARAVAATSCNVVLDWIVAEGLAGGARKRVGRPKKAK
ncbi:hypothetical protein LCGC14_0017710 [marine sediment metagenome]|uniref:Uncharacterized protein n=1 Tax=marine sediment metagenome TaxID=412755 RepID=A0A0F9YGE6_9ZZZZ